MNATLIRLGANAVAAAALFWLGQHGQVWWGALLVVALHGRGLVEGQRVVWRRWLEVLPTLLFGLSILGLIALNPKLLPQVGWATIYWAGVSWASQLAPKRAGRLLQAAAVQFTGINALFLAVAVWHWPAAVLMVGGWLVSFVAASYWLAAEEARAKTALAAAWGLIVAECSWVFAIWAVNYILLGGLIIIPQAAVVLTVLGYCFGSIYIAQTAGQLSRARLLEYLVIGLTVVVVVIAGTNWKGTI